MKSSQPDPDIANRLRELIDDWELNPKEASRRMRKAGVPASSYASLRNYVSLKSEPSLAFLRGAAAFFCVSEKWLIVGTGPKTSSNLESIVERAGLTDGPLPLTVCHKIASNGLQLTMAGMPWASKDDDPEAHEAFFKDAARMAAFLAAYIQLPIEAGILICDDLSPTAWESHATKALDLVNDTSGTLDISTRNDTLISSVTALVQGKKEAP